MKLAPFQAPRGRGMMENLVYGKHNMHIPNYHSPTYKTTNGHNTALLHLRGSSVNNQDRVYRTLNNIHSVKQYIRENEKKPYFMLFLAYIFTQIIWDHIKLYTISFKPSPQHAYFFFFHKGPSFFYYYTPVNNRLSKKHQTEFVYYQYQYKQTQFSKVQIIIHTEAQLLSHQASRIINQYGNVADYMEQKFSNSILMFLRIMNCILPTDRITKWLALQANFEKTLIQLPSG